MAWELVEEAFPNGHIFEETGFVTANDLRNNPDIDMVTIRDEDFARKMVIAQNVVAFGKNNEYMEGTTYHVYNNMPHVNDYERPLNVFGAAMVNDYLRLNGIILGG